MTAIIGVAEILRDNPGSAKDDPTAEAKRISPAMGPSPGNSVTVTYAAYGVAAERHLRRAAVPITGTLRIPAKTNGGWFKPPQRDHLAAAQEPLLGKVQGKPRDQRLNRLPTAF